MATDTTAAAPSATPDDAPSHLKEPAPTRGRSAMWLPLVLVLVAALLRFSGLGYPDRIFFDETYYAPQGQEMIQRGVEEGFAVHPPVGKWLIGAGIAIFGYDAFGFRAASAAAGTLTVLFTYFAGVRLFRRRGVAALAAFFVAIDGLALTMSRIAMLDIFLSMFVMLGVWFLLKDRDIQWSGLPAGPPVPERPLPRRSHLWRWMAGIAFGLALSTKWSALLAIGGAGLFVGISELLWRRRLTGSMFRGWWRGAASALLTLAVVPLLIYVISYVGWFINYSDTRLGLEECADGSCNLSVPEIASRWWGEQQQIAYFHRTLEAEHPYRSLPTTWPYLGRPVAYYYEACDDEKLAAGECVTEQGNVEEILGIGNPAIWWLGLFALPLAGWFSARGDWRALTILGFYAIQYVPWLVVPRPNFLFYMTPVVPFLCLAVAFALWRVSSHPFLRWVPAAATVTAVAAFLFWYPLWTAIEMPLESWQLRIWFDTWI